MNNNEMDKLIKDSIDTSLNDVELRDEVFTRVLDNIGNQEKRSNYRALKFPFSRLHSLKVAAGIMCAVILLSSVSLVISPNARVFAADAIQAIKTIFVYDDNGEIVEKSQNDPILGYAAGGFTTLNDSEIGKLLGCKVVFPECLSDDFVIGDKFLGVSLHKPISYETSEKIKLSIQKAATEDAEFEGLKDYGATRYASAAYKNPEGTIGIYVEKLFVDADKDNKAKKSKSNYEEIKIGSIKGIWEEYEAAEYPTKTEGGITSTDLTQKPTGKTTSYSVSWVSDGLQYRLIAFDGYKLTPETGARVAEAFMESQK
jgi:hypothetical protein